MQIGLISGLAHCIIILIQVLCRLQEVAYLVVFFDLALSRLFLGFRDRAIELGSTIDTDCHRHSVSVPGRFVHWSDCIALFSHVSTEGSHTVGHPRHSVVCLVRFLALGQSVDTGHLVEGTVVISCLKLRFDTLDPRVADRTLILFNTGNLGS